MSSVLNQLPNSRLSLEGNSLTATPSPFNTTNPSWGYSDSSIIPNPADSKLQNTYSVDGNPNERIIDFNRQALGGVSAVKAPSNLDELDINAPNFIHVGGPYTVGGNIMSQIYKSAIGRKYRDLGPQPGFY
jgi:hypothetical protein